MEEVDIRLLIKDLEDPDSEVSIEFREAGKRWEKITEPFLQRLRDCERLTSEDLGTVVY